MLGLHGCLQAFSGRGEQGLLSSSDARASHHGGLSCWGTRALECAGPVGVVHGLSYSMADFPRPRIEPMSPALTGRFLATGRPGRSPRN